MAHDIPGTVFKNGSAVLMARIVDAAGVEITQAAITAIEYSIYELNPCQSDSLSVVAGHDGVNLGVEDVVFDTLQTDDLWTVDAEGYNFRHVIDVALDEAFPVAGVHYQVRFELTPASGQKVVVRFRLVAI
jgi:hypothetical protein